MTVLLSPEIRKAKKKYRAQTGLDRRDKLGSIIEMKLTFNEWLKIWIDSGHWHERGVHKGQYCMSRINDIGHYELGNIEIKLHSDNCIEGNVGRKHTPETLKFFSELHYEGREYSNQIEAMRISNTGNTYRLGLHDSEETKTKKSLKLKGIPVSKIRCLHCNKVGGIGAMKRWHLDNCRDKQ